ncbi:hypothetical protein PseAD21_28190 [Pseudomonas sp. AD21]|nr:hypothetical protein PseAD21_28190 [Pseudomonas sp. AD21]
MRLGLARVHGRHHATGAGLDTLDHDADFFHRILGTLGEVAHFIGHHRETTPALAGASRFDGGVERQQVGLFGDAADHFQHRADLLAVDRQRFDFGHGFADFISQLIDVAGAALDDRHAVPGRLIGALGSVGRVRCAVGDIVGGGAHFVGGGGNLVDLAELHLHAFAGLAGDFRRLVGGATGLGDALLDLGDGRLQLVEEAVEPVHQFAQFILLAVVQALGQVTFTAGNVLQHVGNAVDRPGHARRGEPDQQQADQTGGDRHQQRSDHSGFLGIIEHRLQLDRVGQQHLFRQVDDHAPGPRAANRIDRVHGANQVALFENFRCAAADQLQQVLAIGAEGVADFLADLGRVGTVGTEHAAAGDDQHVPGVVEQGALGLHGCRLQGVEGDVDTDHADGLAVDDQRHGNGRHQHFLGAHGVGIRVEQAGALVVARAGVPAVIRRAAEAEGGLGHVFFDHDRVQRRAGGAAPVTRKTPGFVGLARGVVDELAVLAIQPVGFEGEPDAEHLVIALERGFQALVQLFTQGAGVQRTLGGQHAHVLDLVGQGGDYRQAFAKSLLHPHCLLGSLGLQQVLHTGGEHLAAGVADQIVVLVGLVNVHADDQRDHTEQAQAGEQDDFQANGERVEHGAIS